MTEPIRLTQRFAQTLTLVLLAVLLFMWSVPGLVAVRNLLPVLLLASALALKPDFRNAARTLRQPLLAIPVIALTLWIVMHNIFLAWEPARAWFESAQWFRSVAVFASSTPSANSPGWQTSTLRSRAWLGTLVISYTLYLAFQIGYKPWSTDASIGTILQQSTPVGSRDLGSYVGTGLVTVWLAELVSQTASRRSMLDAPRWLSPAALLVSVGLTVAMMTRNVLPVLLVLVFGAFVAYARTRRRDELWRTVTIGIIAVAVLAMAAAVSVHNDPRWKTLTAAATAGADIEHNKAWLAAEAADNMPLDKAGQPVDSSAYMRTAWIVGLLNEISRHPLGVGYDRDAFGRALQTHYGKQVSTKFGHSGILDFTLGVGIPGGLLLVSVLSALTIAGNRRWRGYRSGAGLALALFVPAYIVRACIDGVVRDHMVEQAFFVAGLLLGLANLPMTPASGAAEQAH